MSGSPAHSTRRGDGAIDIIAHRGASAYAPENTLAAFELAAEMNADGFELDCGLTKDGEIAIIHDDTIDRTTDSTGRVEDFTLDELRRLDAGAWFGPKFAGEHIPTLDEAIELAQKSRIGVLIEIKDADDDSELMDRIVNLAQEHNTLSPELRQDMMALIEASGTRNIELTRKVIQTVRDHGAENEIVLQSFSPIVCAIALAEAPGLRTELLGNSDKKHPKRWGLYLGCVTLLDVPGFNVAKGDLTEELVTRMHQEGRTVAAWVANKKKDIQRMAGLHVDAIITDRPDRCRDILTQTDRNVG